jgi:hypothetical protein
MPMQFIRNIQFTRLLKTGGRLREFNFRKSGAEEKFSVDTVDDRGNRIMFTMIKENGSWRLGNILLPAWITDYEGLLHENIEEELSHFH